MSTIKAFELRAVDLPFKNPFKHAAAERRSSYSILLKCVNEDGVAGFGECLPREYVTGESRHWVFELLAEKILPRLVGRTFNSLAEVKEFLSDCDGNGPCPLHHQPLGQAAGHHRQVRPPQVTAQIGRVGGTAFPLVRPGAELRDLIETGAFLPVAIEIFVYHYLHLPCRLDEGAGNRMRPALIANL